MDAFFSRDSSYDGVFYTGVHPDRERRWFKAHHGMTFHAYARARRLGTALARIREVDRVVSAALDHGYESLSGFNAAVRGLTGYGGSLWRKQRLLELEQG